jgi:hypothetical protein
MPDRYVVNVQCFVNPYLLDEQIKPIEQDFWAELAQIQAECIGWILLSEGD